MLQKYIPTPKREYIYNIVSKTSGFTPYGIGDRDTASEEILNAYDSIVKGESELHNFMYARKGYTTSVYPIKDGGNVVAIVGVVKNMELLNKAKTNYIVQVLLIEAYMIDEMAIYLKALEIQGLFRILGAKNIFHFYGCKISTSETRTSDLLPKMRANNC